MMRGKIIGGIDNKWKIKTNSNVKRNDILINPEDIKDFKWEVTDFIDL